MIRTGLAPTAGLLGGCVRGDPASTTSRNKGARSSRRRLRVLVVYGADWVLRRVADSMREIGSERVDVTIRSAVGMRSYQFILAQLRHDVVHFLSPWYLYSYASGTFRPSVVTVWHMEPQDWPLAIRWASRVDRILVPNRQIRAALEDRIGKGSRIGRGLTGYGPLREASTRAASQRSSA